MTIEVIAEIGCNHQGDMATACKLVDAAIDAGCDTAKFQLWDTERVYPRERWDEMKRLELSRYDMANLKQYCESKGIGFLCTPDEIEDAQFLKEIGVKRIKTSSQDVTNLPFLKAVSRLGLPMIVSTGACNQRELFRAIKTICMQPYPAVLHCVSAYPAPLDEMNLAMIRKINRMTNVSEVGLSDHTDTIVASLVALGAGATIFEKHLTLSRDQPGPDHAASLTPVEMADYVGALRVGDLALGDGIKRIMPCEVENRKRYEEFIKPRMTC